MYTSAIKIEFQQRIRDIYFSLAHEEAENLKSLQIFIQNNRTVSGPELVDRGIIALLRFNLNRTEFHDV